MAYLDTYTTPLTAATAAHLLRRATFGPTQQEIADFTGKTASQAVDILINNASYRATPPPPVEMDATRSDAGQPFLGKSYDENRSFSYYNYIRNWWIGFMAEQNGRPSVLEKLTAFWQNHFVVTYASIQDYRFAYRYLALLRSNSLGNFKEMAISMTKDPGMLIFQNGNENWKELPNENYARELQELFTVGQKDFNGVANYTEQDVKAAARVLTGWQASNLRKAGTTEIGSSFNPDRHDTGDKTFSAKYNNTIIAGRSGADAGEVELRELINMLLSHPESPKYICRELYRWYVNPNVTAEIEEQVIKPLATFFAGSSNNFAIEPIIRTLLTSVIFFDSRNFGAIVKSPAELLIGTVRIFDVTVPDYVTDYSAFNKMIAFLSSGMDLLQLNLLNQPSVFGSLPYYQTGYSRNWINETTIGQRGTRTDAFIYPYLELKPGSLMAIDILGRLRQIQPNFSDVSGTPGITCEQVLAEFTKNLFPFELPQAQKDFLIDSIMMMKNSARTTWVREWDAYRSAPNDPAKQNVVLWRSRTLLKYLLRMAEYQLF
ncbi:MAG: DUF1800 family protein [Dyadobacter sp.]|uniref:DUF1800 domain-containing protein n=1 Tax=Dyadobacter sp. TaxID=1914288 RepID=UPI001B0C2D46|nr:DUF1800 family protein [Dyadobacter sp.]MBO9616400.1 DUF1800 family protein [Dyadobacter sp.]